MTLASHDAFYDTKTSMWVDPKVPQQYLKQRKFLWRRVLSAHTIDCKGTAFDHHMISLFITTLRKLQSRCAEKEVVGNLPHSPSLDTFWFLPAVYSASDQHVIMEMMMKDGAQAGMESNYEFTGKDNQPSELKTASSFTWEVWDGLIGYHFGFSILR